MEASDAARVLVVANKTAATPALLEAVRRRAASGAAEFFLLMPNPEAAEWHPLHPEQHDTKRGHELMVLALPLLDEAAAGHVEGAVSIRHDPMDAIEELLAERDFDEIILSTLPTSVSRWLHIDLPRRVEHLGLPVTTVTARERQTAIA
jgi:hypothetical protein